MKSKGRGQSQTHTNRLHTHMHTQHQRRYIVANVNGVPAWVLGWLVWACPDRVADFIMKRFS